jgi:NADPH:quinone reductase-like Zn-dependent oxidoreductase
MKAILFEQYGSPDVLEMKEVEKPTPTDDQVLIKVMATAVNPHTSVTSTYNLSTTVDRLYKKSVRQIYNTKPMI